MEPISLAVGVGGIGFQFFHIAKKAWSVFGDIRNVAGDASLLQTRIKIEQIRFETWAEQVGLSEDKPEQFEERCKKSDPRIYPLALEILIQVCDLLTKHTVIEKKYGLEPLSKQIAKKKEAEPDAPPLLSSHSSNLAAWALPRQDTREQALMEFQRRIGKVLKIKWALADKKKLAILVDNLTAVNTGLKEILPPDAQRDLERQLIMHQPSDVNELDELSKTEGISIDQSSKDYAAAAAVKGLVLRSAGTSSNLMTAISVSAAKLLTGKVEPQRVGTGWVISKISGENGVKTDVLIEYVDMSDDSKRAVKYLQTRFQDLVVLLQKSPKPRGYRVLDCEGYFQEGTSNDGIYYGIVFRLPQSIVRNPGPTVHTLYDLLRGEKDNKPPVAFLLGDRYRLASSIANSIWHIHCAGWLHRSLRSENILCLSNNGAQSILSPYLGGFTHARLDDTREISRVDKSTMANLYRHPDYQYPSPRISKYRRSYEIYSLGIILIEIALWKRIGTFWKPIFDTYAFSEHLRAEVVPLLGHYMGDNYRQVVRMCLDSSLLMAGEDEGLQLSEGFSQKVVRVLENCYA